MIKKTVKNFVPRAILDWRRRRIALRNQLKFFDRSAADTFSEIYAANLWGGESGQFCSGEGSSEAFGDQYGAAIRMFIRDHKIRSVADLGCGDFTVAGKFVSAEIDYIGIDVVEPLIERNRKTFGNEKVRFERLDISQDELPPADLCLIRQVLQHLSNAEISEILVKCRRYPYLIVTEHYPGPNQKLVPNLDIPHGPGIRLYFDSAVVLDQPPFDLPNVELLFEAEGDNGTRVKSFLVKN
ncbi:MAG: class I SAM-dependent methyltransferase [Chloracidobacterium sp.]|nr:class I SAM-dependent methyltransferase [Chloracidobacterium sp.]